MLPGRSSFPLPCFVVLRTLVNSSNAWSGLCLSCSVGIALCTHLFVATHKGPLGDRPWLNTLSALLLQTPPSSQAPPPLCRSKYRLCGPYPQANCCWSARGLSTETKNNRNFYSNLAEEFLSVESNNKKMGLVLWMPVHVC